MIHTMSYETHVIIFNYAFSFFGQKQNILRSKTNVIFLNLNIAKSTTVSLIRVLKAFDFILRRPYRVIND